MCKHYKPLSLAQIVIAKECLELDLSSPTRLRWKKKLPSSREGYTARNKVGGVAGYIRTNKAGSKKSGIRLGWAGTVRVHRLVYLLTYGIDVYPLTIDHIDRNHHNNKIENLRPATYKMQMNNRVISKKRTDIGKVSNSTTRGKSGLRWVSKHGRKWRGVFSYDSKMIRTPQRLTKEEAYADVLALREKMGLTSCRPAFPN